MRLDIIIVGYQHYQPNRIHQEALNLLSNLNVGELLLGNAFTFELFKRKNPALFAKL